MTGGRGGVVAIIITRSRQADYKWDADRSSFKIERNLLPCSEDSKKIEKNKK